MSKEIVNEVNRPFQYYKYLSLIEKDLVEAISAQILEEFNNRNQKVKETVTDTLIINFVDNVLKNDSDIRNEINECFTGYYANENLTKQKIDILLEIIKLKCLDHFGIFNESTSFKDIEKKIDRDLLNFNFDEVFKYGKSILDLNDAEFENVRLFLESKNKDILPLSISDYYNGIQADIEHFHQEINILQLIKNDFDKIILEFKNTKRVFNNLKNRILQLQHSKQMDLIDKEFTQEKRFAIYEELVKLIIKLYEVQSNLELELKLPKEFNLKLLDFNNEADLFVDENSFEIITNLIIKIENFNKEVNSHIFSQLNLTFQNQPIAEQYSLIFNSKLLNFKKFPYLSNLKDFGNKEISELNETIILLFKQQVGGLLREKFAEFKERAKDPKDVTPDDIYLNFIEQTFYQLKKEFEVNVPELIKLQELFAYFKVDGLLTFESVYNQELDNSNNLKFIRFEMNNYSQRIANEIHKELHFVTEQAKSSVEQIQNFGNLDNDEDNGNGSNTDDEKMDDENLSKSNVEKFSSNNQEVEENNSEIINMDLGEVKSDNTPTSSLSDVDQFDESKKKR